MNKDGFRILVVDDEEGMREGLEKALGLAGFSVATAASAAVSVRSVRGPRDTGRKPASRASSISAGLKPPSGPTSRQSLVLGGGNGALGNGPSLPIRSADGVSTRSGARPRKAFGLGT